MVAQMLRWGPATQRRGSFFDDRAVDPRSYTKVPSIHRAIRDHGGRSYIVEPEIFRNEAMTRMHGAEATYIGYLLPSTMGVRVRQLLDGRAEDDSPLYIYAYWSGVDTVAHWYGPRGPEHAAEAALLDRALERALGDRDAGDTLVILTADHGHASVDPARMAVSGWGETKPVAPNSLPTGADNPEGRRKNRRVDITLRTR